MPKPLIDVDGMPMFMRALQSFANVTAPQKNIFVIQKPHDEEFHIGSHIRKQLPDAKIVMIPALTRGAAETSYAARDHISADEPLVIMDCDVFVQSSQLNEIMQAVIEGKGNCDAALVTFHADADRYSYVKSNDGIATEVAEKRVISDRAIAGAYFFASGALFLETCEQVLAQQLSEKTPEYYLSLLYNELIARKKIIRVCDADTYHSFGTPEELKDYEKTS